MTQSLITLMTKFLSVDYAEARSIQSQEQRPELGAVRVLAAQELAQVSGGSKVTIDSPRPNW